MTHVKASGKLAARPGLDAALKTLRKGDTLIVWKLGITRQTLYRHVAPDGNLRDDGMKLLAKKIYLSDDL